MSLSTQPRRAQIWGLGIGLLWLVGCGGEPSQRLPEPIDQYVCGMTAGEGVDLSRVSERALPGIWRVLEDNGRRRCWNEALMVAGHVGGPEAYIHLVGFIEARSASFALSEDMVYLQTAFQAVAQTARVERTQRSSAQAIDYLVESSEPSTWEKRAIDWELDAVMKRELVRVLTSSAVQAMGGLSHPRISDRLNLLAMEASDRNAYRFKYRDTDPSTDVAAYLINLHVIPPGRVAYGMLEAEVRLREMSGSAVRSDVQSLRELAQETFDKEQAWLAARRGEQAWLKAIADANALADVRLNGLHGQLRSLKDLLDTADAKQSIQRVEEVIFPEGPLPVIDSDFPDQVKFVLAACNTLTQRFGSELVALKLVNHVQVTREAHEALDKALRSGIGGQGFEEVLRARSRLQIALRVLVAKLISTYPGYDKADRARRDAILEPILNQDEQVAGYMKRRVQVRDVEPKSGQELDPLEEGGAIDKSKTPGIGDPEGLRRKIRQQMRDETSR